MKHNFNHWSYFASKLCWLESLLLLFVFFFFHVKNSVLKDEPPKLTGIEFVLTMVLPYAGYICWQDDLKGRICAPCPPGTYHIVKDGFGAECVPCPPGEKK